MRARIVTRILFSTTIRPAKNRDAPTTLGAWKTVFLVDMQPQGIEQKPEALEIIGSRII